MFTIKVAVIAAFATLLLQARAFAEPLQARQVVVGNGIAQGSFQAASTSADRRQYLTCGLTMELSGPTNEGPADTRVSLSCSAADANGKYYLCSMQNPSDAWIKMVAHLTQGSWIAFAGDAEGHCHSLTVQ